MRNNHNKLCKHCKFPPSNSVHLVQSNRSALSSNQGLSGIPELLSGIPEHFQSYHFLNIEYGNMSRSRRPRKIKPLNPDEQPPLFKFISDSPKTPTEVKSADSKKRRRSTGEKPRAKKRADSTSNRHHPLWYHLTMQQTNQIKNTLLARCLTYEWKTPTQV